MPFDPFTEIMGVTLDEWIQADTPEKLAALLDRRDHPPLCTIDHTELEILTMRGDVVGRYRGEPCNGTHPPTT